MTHSQQFENDVKTYGTQAEWDRTDAEAGFENDVKTYGTQAGFLDMTGINKFENDVKTYGTQACYLWLLAGMGLRMM